MAVKLSPVFNDAQLDSNGNPLNGGKLYTYIAGTTTPQTTYTTSAGSTPQANPIVLNARGEPDNPIWLTEGLSYKFVLKTAADVTIRTVDNVAGVNDSTTTTVDQWITPSVSSLTYVSATSFTVAGDQTSVFQPGRRIRAVCTAGTIYGVIQSSTFGASTSVIVGWDSTQLDSGLSAVALGLLTPQNHSIPSYVMPYPASYRNLLINAAFEHDQVNEGASTATADDVYCFDGCYVLTQTASVNVSQLDTPETGFTNAIRLTQNQAAAQRMGLAQIVNFRDSRHLSAKNVAFTPRVRISNSQAIRYAILNWIGTPDAVTSDVVLDWTSGTYTAGNFFLALASGVDVVAVGAQTPSANTWTTLATISGANSSSVGNLIVLVWTEGTAAQNVTLDLDFWQLETGSVGTEFERRPWSQELQLCRQYVEKSYAFGTAPGTVTTAGQYSVRNSTASNTTLPGLEARFSVEKYGTPTVTIYSPGTGASGNIRNVTSSADVSVSSLTGTGVTGTGYVTTGSSLTDTHILSAHFLAVYRL